MRTTHRPDDAVDGEQIGNWCQKCGKSWINGDCSSTVSRRGLCARKQRALIDALSLAVPVTFRPKAAE